MGGPEHLADLLVRCPAHDRSEALASVEVYRLIRVNDYLKAVELTITALNGGRWGLMGRHGLRIHQGHFLTGLLEQ